MQSSRVLVRQYHGLRRLPTIVVVYGTERRRGYAMFVAQVLRNVLKLRYVVLGGAIGGGYSVHRKYEDFKSSFPDISPYLPPPEKLDEFRASLIEFKNSLKDQIQARTSNQSTADVISRSVFWANGKLNGLTEWLEERAQMAESELKGMGVNGVDVKLLSTANAAQEERPPPTASSGAQFAADDLRRRQQRMQDDLMSVQLKYQREIERLERENKELRKQVILMQEKKGVTNRKIKKSLIDLYSEVLDELADYDSTYNIQDNLPRVVVVGDQSSGKTSVLEMIAQARLFPRGAGEMMTRSPVKVTLSEGPYHVAQFRDSQREFDLTKETDLADLRREIELRMKNSVRGGQTVSSNVISLTVKGPGLQRMVLVDLPGIISTVTTDMAPDTKDKIKHMIQHHMGNPNAIILCIQDGSLDAERSNVTDLVSQIDPQGKRTVLVLTKVDLAEQSLANPDRIKKILEGKLFPMKSIGNFAVVTGRGNNDDSIDKIRQYEENFFRNSKLFKDAVLSPAQMTTQNLSMAVADTFWKMVRDSVEQQADAFKATRFNLETEWKNTYPMTRELDRDELFDKARGEILDEVVNLSQLGATHWETVLKNRLWDKITTHVFENIYLAAAQADGAGGDARAFNTAIDIRLKQWADSMLPRKCVETGWETLQAEFRKFVDSGKKQAEVDHVYDNLKETVLHEAIQRHSWEDKAADVLRVIQLNALEDTSVPDKAQWDAAVKFFDDFIKEKQASVELKLKDMVGPGWQERWTSWISLTQTQRQTYCVQQELERLLAHDAVHRPVLSFEEITAVRKNLQTRGVDVEAEAIRETWHPVYRRFFLDKASTKAKSCRKGFYLYHQGVEGDCNEIVLFWRIGRMLHATSNALRQQVMNREGRRLEKEIKDVLDELSQDSNRKANLLTGKRVQLAEELKRVRRIQEKLEEFIQVINTEK